MPIGMFPASIQMSDETVNNNPATIHKVPGFLADAIAISAC
jgi:hypothetical protein